MKKLAWTWIIIFLVPALSLGQVEKTKAELLDILALQKTAWNERNIEGFMAYYWNSDKFTFQSGANRLHGWNALLDRYKKSYSGESWGKLDFTDLEVNVLADDYAYVLGRWKLELKDAPREGVFTIIFKRLPEGWRIIHDHSS